jgi:hypothetical protein
MGYSAADFAQKRQDQPRSFSVPPVSKPLHPDVDGMTANALGTYTSPISGYPRSNSPGSMADALSAIHTQAAGNQNQSPVGNSRSARMRRALSVPTRPVSTVAAILPPQSLHYASSDLQQATQPEVIAEFGPRDLQAPYPFSPVSFSESAGHASPFGTSALPPRLQATAPSRSRSKPWQQGLPPRFRNCPSPPRVVTPPEALWTPVPNVRSTSSLNSLATAFQPQLSQSQHLSSFLKPNNVSYSSGIPCDTWPVQQQSTLIEVPSPARALAPIGAERARRLASTANVIPSNCATNPTNTKLQTNFLAFGPPPGLGKPSALLGNSDARLSGHVPNPRLFRLEHTKDVAPQESRTEVERFFQWRKQNKHATRICSPLSPLRNPDSWSVSDGKWRRQELEQRRLRTLASCETSIFRRKLKDHRSRM